MIGDFNATTRYAAYRRLAARLSDLQKALPAAPVATFTARTPMLRIDHLWGCGRVKILDCWALNHALARTASDHLPLVGDLELSPET